MARTTAGYFVDEDYCLGMIAELAL